MPHATAPRRIHGPRRVASGPRPRSGRRPAATHRHVLDSGSWPKVSGGCPRSSSSVAAAVAIAGGVVGFRRLGARRERVALDDGRALEVRAKGLIVQADTAVREAEREVAFAEAQFGAADRTRAARRARDRPGRGCARRSSCSSGSTTPTPDSAAERRGVERAHRRPLRVRAARASHETDAALAARRRAERGVGADLPALREDAARLEPAGARTPRRRSSGSARGSRRRRSAPRTRHQFARMRPSATATAALDDAERRLARSEPAAEALAVVADRLERAGARPRPTSRDVELELAAAQADAAEEAAALDAELAAARGERDAQDDADAGRGPRRGHRRGLRR